MYLASCLDLPSYSEPDNFLNLSSSFDSLAGIFSLNTRTCILSLKNVSFEKVFPIISLLSIAINSQLFRMLNLFSLIFFARCVEPKSPCSSPENAAKIIDTGNSLLDITLANSITAATPDKSSFAPGASITLSITFSALESK